MTQDSEGAPPVLKTRQLRTGDLVRCVDPTLDWDEKTCLEDLKTYLVSRAEGGYVSVDCCVEHLKKCSGGYWRASRFVLASRPRKIPAFMRRASVPSDGKEV